MYDYFRVWSVLVAERPPPSGAEPVGTVDWSAAADLWTAKVVIKTPYPERTAGGVWIMEDGGIGIDLSLGVAVAQARRPGRGFSFWAAFGVLDLGRLVGSNTVGSSMNGTNPAKTCRAHYPRAARYWRA